MQKNAGPVECRRRGRVNPMRPQTAGPRVRREAIYVKGSRGLYLVLPCQGRTRLFQGATRDGSRATVPGGHPGVSRGEGREASLRISGPWRRTSCRRFPTDKVLYVVLRLSVPHIAVTPAPGDQFLMGSQLDRLPVVEYRHPVAEPAGGQAVGDSALLNLYY